MLTTILKCFCISFPINSNLGQQEVTSRLKKSKFNCHEDNSNKQAECLNEYYALKLNCTLPWIASKRPQNRAKCQGRKKFTEFRNLSMSIGNSRDIGELEKKGCLMPNCKQRTWQIQYGQKNKPHGQNNTELQLSFPHSSKVLIRNEINLYTVSSFFADFGGYMGLLLGESLISYFLLIIQWLKNIVWSKKVQAAQ